MKSSVSNCRFMACTVIATSLCFRMRTKYDDKGKVVEAFYGKIYGDIAMGWSYQGVSSVSFLYYFNPTPNDRNLEWDRKNNLCPNPGNLGNKLMP